MGQMLEDTVFIQGLPESVTEELLAKHFSSVGAVKVGFFMFMTFVILRVSSFPSSFNKLEGTKLMSIYVLSYLCCSLSKLLVFLIPTVVKVVKKIFLAISRCDARWLDVVECCHGPSVRSQL